MYVSKIYELDSLILSRYAKQGRVGGYKTVYKAKTSRLARPFAAKILKSGYETDDFYVSLLEREQWDYEKLLTPSLLISSYIPEVLGPIADSRGRTVGIAVSWVEGPILENIRDEKKRVLSREQVASFKGALMQLATRGVCLPSSCFDTYNLIHPETKSLPPLMLASCHIIDSTRTNMETYLREISRVEADLIRAHATDAQDVPEE